MICNAFKLDRMSPATEAMVGSLMAGKAKNEGHKAILPAMPGKPPDRHRSSVTPDHVLDVILANPGITLAEIAARLDCTPGMVSMRMTVLRTRGIKIVALRKLHNGTDMRSHYSVKRGMA